MKSRKKVPRKKAAPHKTRSRRGQSRSKRRTKRGGMIRSARTLFYHDIFPLLSRARLNIYLGREPTPDEYAITKENDRYYGTILDIPVDDGIKESIKNLREELENSVKTADKFKSIKEKYDAIIKKLEEEKKKQIAKQERELMVVGKAFTPSPRQLPQIQNDSPIGFSHSTGIKENMLRSVVKPPFSSPDIKRNPYYSSTKKSPAKPLSKGELSLHRIPDYDDIDGPETPSKILFGTDTPMSSPHFRSPPPPDQIINHENQKPQLLLSPDHTGILKKLDFSNTQ